MSIRICRGAGLLLCASMWTGWAIGARAQPAEPTPPKSFEAIEQAFGDEPSAIEGRDEEELEEELSAGPSASSADDLAKELANPNTPVMALRNFLDITTFRGSAPRAERWSFGYTFQVSLPFKFDVGNLIFRPSVPVLFGEPFVDSSGNVDQAVAFGNIGLDAAFGKTFDFGLLLIGGLSMKFPTSSKSELRGDWALGPELAVGYVGKLGLFGALFGYVWDVPTSDQAQTLVGQYFYALGIGGGWQIAAQPTWSYRRDAKQLTFPIGLGVQKVALLGKRKQLMQLGAQLWAYAAQSDVLGPIWQLRFSVAPVVPVPWEKSPATPNSSSQRDRRRHR